MASASPDENNAQASQDLRLDKGDATANEVVCSLHLRDLLILAQCATLYLTYQYFSTQHKSVEVEEEELEVSWHQKQMASLAGVVLLTIASSLCWAWCFHQQQNYWPGWQEVTLLFLHKKGVQYLLFITLANFYLTLTQLDANELSKMRNVLLIQNLVTNIPTALVGIYLLAKIAHHFSQRWKKSHAHLLSFYDKEGFWDASEEASWANKSFAYLARLTPLLLLFSEEQFLVCFFLYPHATVLFLACFGINMMLTYCFEGVAKGKVEFSEAGLRQAIKNPWMLSGIKGILRVICFALPYAFCSTFPLFHFLFSYTPLIDAIFFQSVIPFIMNEFMHVMGYLVSLYKLVSGIFL